MQTAINSVGFSLATQINMPLPSHGNNSSKFKRSGSGNVMP